MSRNAALAPNIGLSEIYSCKYLTFSNSQQVWQCQNVLTARRTVHLSLIFTADILAGGAVVTLIIELVELSESAPMQCICAHMIGDYSELAHKVRASV